MALKPLIMGILALLYLFELCQFWLAARSRRNPIPANVADVYDRPTYEKWLAHDWESRRLAIIGATVTTAVTLILWGCNCYAAFAGLFPATPFMQMLAVVLLTCVIDVVNLPFSYIDTMVIEEKYGFNRSSKKTFWLDQLKQFIISTVIMIGVCWILMALHQWLGDWIILPFAIVMTVILLLITLLFPVLSRIFNKFTPLEDEELRTALTSLMEKHHYKVRTIQVMDASRRTTRANAYFAGFGKMKTIVLYDTLLSTMTHDEICAVFAHEMGHGLHRDTLKNQLLSFAQMLILGVLAWFTLRTEGLYTAFGFSGVNYGFAVLLIMNVEFALIQPLFGLLVNWHSRRAEYRADQQAAQEGYGSALVSGLKKLARDNLVNLAPDPLLVKLTYSHPTLSQRIGAINSDIKDE